MNEKMNMDVNGRAVPLKALISVQSAQVRKTVMWALPSGVAIGQLHHKLANSWALDADKPQPKASQLQVVIIKSTLESYVARLTAVIGHSRCVVVQKKR